MASLLTAGRGAARLLLRRAVPAALSRQPVLHPGLDFDPKQEPARKRLWNICKEAASEPNPRPVLPLEIRYDREQEVPILCRAPRHCYLKYATDATDLVHPDLYKYWVPEVVQELYTDIVNKGFPQAAAAADECEFGTQMEATLQAFERFGSLVFYHMGTCCVTDKDGRLSVVVDDNFCNAVRTNPRFPGIRRYHTHSTGYALWTVSKSAFQCRAFKVETDHSWSYDNQYVVFDADKFRVATGATEEEVNRAGQVKVAVEIDRSRLGQGKLVVFMPYASARNRFEVYMELCNAGLDMKGLRVSKPPVTSPEWPQFVWYTLYQHEEASDDDDKER